MNPTTTRTGLTALTGLLTLCFLSAGCVPQSQSDAWRKKYQAADESIMELRLELEGREDELAALRGRSGVNGQLSAEAEALRAQNQQLRDTLAMAQEQLRSVAGSPLPAELTSDLEALAADNPDLMTFDPNTGMIRFRSDVTFALGKTDVQEGARQLLAQVAGVLSSPAASGYEVRVVGHTDNVPVTNAANVQKYEDNWGMSAFRAISVMRVLSENGVPQERISVTGYGPMQPVEPNGPRGSEANRRVELFLTPQTAAVSNGAMSEPRPADPVMAEPASIEPMAAPGPADTPAMFK
ncbi:OmpA family protein [Phycisphaera mikurensis]|uniref:OmpA-like domain-containing protein n=1 Tax=Phycisphaera mikurensis (strain NBRC 102666 / KCTC 22515 / FYK2301M01) TaxID=1142394 RepID=I0IBK1_PHYMF|nr:OmpA family protein [Phycisphaera mikurensis]MBB6442831.1 chemotaxis protein MotB [Phycisphaera mikurensis]BAM02639.1 hypothetical protein PSMK_04800 [Phycisphaera mikurensis NBRC 102666]